MATVYTAKIISHWVNYTEKDLQSILEEAIKEKMSDSTNEISVEVVDRS